jgi:hypothetical protein
MAIFFSVDIIKKKIVMHSVPVWGVPIKNCGLGIEMYLHKKVAGLNRLLESQPSPP